jgi:hypothetical protein
MGTTSVIVPNPPLPLASTARCSLGFLLCTELSDGEATYGRYQVVCDGSAWIGLADRHCTGPTAQHNRPTTTIDPRDTRRSPAPITDTTTAATTRHWGCCANPPAHTPITAVRIGIHKLHSPCDTQAMNCQAACVPVSGSAAASLAAPAGATSSCNLSCGSQQLVCKQSCGLGQ